MSSTIVIIDDDQEFLEDIKTFLEVEDFEIITYNKSADFIEFVEKDKLKGIDLIILDVVMPDISGIDLMKKICSQGLLKNIPLLFLSGIEDDSLVIKAHNCEHEYRALSVDFVIKPSRPGFLLSRIRNAIYLKKLYENLADSKEVIAVTNLGLSDLLKDKKCENDYLKNRLVKILNKDITDVNSKLDIVRKLISRIAVNDLGLLKLVLTIIEKNQEQIDSFIGDVSEDEEIFKLLSRSIEPLKTAVADIEQVIDIFMSVGLANEEEMIQFSVEKTSFFEILDRMYQYGGISKDLFDQLLKIAKFDFSKSNIIEF